MTNPAPDTRCLTLIGTVIETHRYHGAWVGLTRVADERRVRGEELELLRMVITERKRQ